MLAYERSCDMYLSLFLCSVFSYIQLAFAGGSLASLRTFRVLRALKTIAVVPGDVCLNALKLDLESLLNCCMVL